LRRSIPAACAGFGGEKQRAGNAEPGLDLAETAEMTQEASKSGYAAAAGAAASTTVTTDADGLTTAMIALPGGAPPYVARPSTGQNWPVVLIAQEIFGLHEHIRDVARRFAKLGYFAVAPDYLIRYGDPAAAPDIDAIRAIVARVPDAVTLAVFDEALAFAATQGGDATRAAVTGFCWGGRIAWLYAAHRPDLRACVPWYGRLDGPHTPAQPLWPIDLSGELRVPTLGLYGGDDPMILVDLVNLLRDRLKAAGAAAEIIIYDNAPHGFYADYRDSFRPETAAQAWTQMRAFLIAHGV
jgi:carboxymethylenebutenolidase